MKTKIKKKSYLLIALTFVFAMSCGRTSNSKEGEEHEHAEGMEHDEADNHDMEGMDHDMGEHEEMMMGEAFTWMPGGNNMAMMENMTDNVSITNTGDDEILVLTPSGQEAFCMFKNKQGNVGVTATIKLDHSESVVKLTYHNTDKNNYEFVALTGNIMQLGRVVNGAEKILESEEVDVPEDWFTLTVTAAGSHYKGYINDNMLIHGHDDEMAPGFVGLIAAGAGSVSVKKVEVTPLEAEH